MATTTLDAMAAAASTTTSGAASPATRPTTEWLVPHFEKMLYDQAGLLRAFLHGWQVTGGENYLDGGDGIVGYVGRDLTTDEGGVYSAEDADSEGVEGRFYVWSPDQIAAAVAEGLGATPPGGAEMAAALHRLVRCDRGGNFEGRTILRRPVGAPPPG